MPLSRLSRTTPFLAASLLVCLALTCDAVAQPGATGPTDAEAAASPAQTYAAQSRAAAMREIVITEKGPADTAAFGDFDRPFLAALWLCVEPTTDAEELDARLNGVLNDRAARERCARILDRPADLVQASDLLRITKGIELAVTRVRVKNPGTLPLDLAVRDAGAERDCYTLKGVKEGQDGVLDLGEVRQACRSSTRVDFLIQTQASPGGTPEVLSGFALLFELPAQLDVASSRLDPPASTQCSEGRRRFRVRLDATGVESVRFRNPRWPPYLGPQNGSEVEKFQQCSDVEFRNEIVTRQFVVTFGGIDSKARWDLATVRGVSVRCPGGTCTATFRVGPGSPVRIPLSALRKAYVKTANAAGAPMPPQSEVVKFSVAFYDDDREPAYATGYFSLVQWRHLVERKSETTWSSAAAFDFGSITDLTEFGAKYAPPGTTIYTVGPPTIRHNDWRAMGNVRASLKLNLGNRAASDLEVRLKSGELGGDDPSLTATKFRIEIYGLTGMTLNVGRGAVAAPSESIALAEAGDGVGLRVARFQINHLFRKQIREAVLDALDTGTLRTDREHHTTVMQWTGQPLGTWPAAVDIYGTIGTRSQSRYGGDPTQPVAASDPPQPTRTDRLYGTVGGELSVAFRPSTRWTGALYRSWARTKLAEPRTAGFTDGGRGTAFLTTISWTNFGSEAAPAKRAVNWTLQGRYGLGSAERNDEEHANRQEAYLGESAGFAPDVIFLSTLSTAFHLREAVHPTLGREGAITPGLGNKHYAGGVVNVPKFELISKLLEALPLPKDAFGDASANVRGHVYWLRQQVDGSNYLGSELDASLTLDLPKGVKSTFTAAAFKPGKGLHGVTPDPRVATGRAFVDRFTWALMATINASIP